MKKYFLIPQPPLTKDFTFLVDDISSNKNWGKAIDIDKIEYNRQLLGEDFNVNLKVKLLLVGNGGTGVFPIGRFITVISIREDENEGSMTFMDFDVPLDKEQLRTMLLSQFSENITKEWLKVYDLLRLEFTDEDDNAILFKPDDLDIS